MFSSSGTIWNLLMILSPNGFSIIFLFAIIIIVAIVTILGYFLFGRMKDEQPVLNQYWSLLWRNELSVIVGHYLGIVVSLIIPFILADTVLGVVGSEFPLTTTNEILANLLFGVFASALCAFVIFIGNYWIALIKKIQEKRKRFRFCLLNSIAYGIVFFLGLLISNFN